MSEPQANDIASAAPAASSPSPGALLRAAREKAGISAEDLGGQLKLAKGTLEALERDDFAALSEPVYVRGYYRKIAKLLPVSDKDLIEAYNARSKPARTVTAPAPTRATRIPLAGGVAAGASSRFPYAGVLIGVAAIALAVIMFVFIDRTPTRRLPAPAESAQPQSEASPAPAPEAQASPAAPAASAPQPAAAATPAPTLAPSAVTAAPAAAPVTKPAAAPAARPAASSGEPVAAVPNQLLLNFSESSFVRVEDARGKTLAIGLVRAGEKQVLDGNPPYTVFLGNAANVKVWFAGQPVDFSAHVNAQNQTARFMVP